MAALTRKYKKIFAKDAAINIDSGNVVFGSNAAGSAVSSNDPATLEGLAAFLTGFSAETIAGTKLPVVGEVQALKYDTDYHLAYIYQNGMQVYDSQTDYYINNLVREDGTGKIWKSLIDNNVGNALVEGANWTLFANLANTLSATTTLSGTVKLLTNAELAAGTDTAKAATAAAILSLFNASSRTANGYLRTPANISGAFGEIIIQWGVATNVDNITNVDMNLPVAFPTSHLFSIGNLSVNNISGYPTGGEDASSYPLSATQVRVMHNFGSTRNISWFSIGY